MLRSGHIIAATRVSQGLLRAPKLNLCVRIDYGLLPSFLKFDLGVVVSHRQYNQ